MVFSLPGMVFFFSFLQMLNSLLRTTFFGWKPLEAVPRRPNLCAILWQNEATERLRCAGVCYDVYAMMMPAQIAKYSKIYNRPWCLILFVCSIFDVSDSV